MSDNYRNFTGVLRTALVCSVMVVMVTAVQAYTGEELAKDAKVKISDARMTALKLHPGQIIKEELEKEAGGSGLRYSFVIKLGEKDYEVGVDAKNGKILENIVEGNDPD